MISPPAVPTSVASRAEISARVFAEQIAMLYRLTPFSLVTSLIATSLVWWLLADSVSRVWLNGWYLAALLLNAVRYASLRHYETVVNVDPDTRKWARQFCIGAVANGALWGACGTVLMPIDDPVMTFALLTILGVIPGMGHASLGSYRPAFYAFMGPFIVPIAVWTLFNSDRVHLAIGVAVSVYLVVLLSIGRRSERETVAALTQRFENELLMAEISDARLRSERAAEGLREEVVQRERAEAEALRAKDAAESANALKSQFLANMSHEIRTPLNGVIGMVELLRRTELTPRQSQLCGTITGSSNALLAVLNNILDFSKIEAGQMAIEQISFDVDQLLEDTVLLFADEAARKQIELVCDRAAVDGLTAQGDPTRLRQVLTNLLSNALKFTERGAVALRVTVTPARSNARRLCFEVTDSGIGMDAAALDRVFQPFVQADGSTSRRYGGTGLGLSISRRLVELMGGQLRVESSAGAGSRFWFEVELPCEPRQAAMRARLMTGKRVLLVDDVDTQVAMLERLLGAWGIVVVAARSRAEAVAVMRGRERTAIDAILIDERLCNDGDRNWLDELSGVGVVVLPPLVLVGDLASQDNVASADHRITSVVIKPIRRADLFTALIDVFSGNVGRDTRRAPVPLPLQRFAGTTALVAEDNAVNQEVAEQLLASLGVAVIVVDDGEQAIDAYQRQRPDLILMDCQMPTLDGYLATERIREIEKRQELSRIPIIALTANALQGDRERCLASGMDDFLGKPFLMDELIAVLGRWAPIPQRDVT